MEVSERSTDRATNAVSKGGSAVLRRLDRALGAATRWVDRVEEVLTSTLLVIIIVINGMEIFTRAVLNNSLFWVFEVNLLLGSWIYFIGICLVYYRRGDITVEFLFNRLPWRVQRIYLIALNVIIVAILAVIIFHGYRLLLVQARTATMGVKIPNHLFSLPVVLGSGSMILILAKQSLAIWLRGDTPEEKQ